MIELESIKCAVRRLQRVEVVRLTYVLFSLVTQSPEGHLNIDTTFVLSRINRINYLFLLLSLSLSNLSHSNCSLLFSLFSLSLSLIFLTRTLPLEFCLSNLSQSSPPNLTLPLFNISHTHPFTLAFSISLSFSLSLSLSLSLSNLSL